MSFFNTIKVKHPDLFEYIKAEEIHPHDHFLDRLMLWMIPHTVTPNKITLFRVFLTPFVFLLIQKEFYLNGVALFLFAAFTDAIDGSLARTRNQVTKFGMLFDPLADKFLIGTVVLLLVFRYFDFWLGFTILGIEIIFIASALVARFKFKTVRMANQWGKLKMIMQVIAVFLTLLALLLEFPYLLTVASWVFGLAIGFALLSLYRHGV